MPDECDSEEFSPESVPRMCEGVDIMGMEVTPEEGYVLGRIDGLQSVGDLCVSTGLGKDKTVSMLRSLHGKGILVFKHREEKAKPGPAEGRGEAGAGEEGHAPGSVYDLQSLKKMLRSDLPKGEEFIPLVDSIFDNLEHLSYYDLLGISRGAKENQLKKAYFKRTKSFHPDKYYRRADRDFKGKLQEIFKQLNKGYKLLADPEARAEYDGSLSEEEDWEEEAAKEPAAQPQSRTRSVKGGASPWKNIRVSKQKPIEEKTRPQKKKEEKEPDKPSGPKFKLGLKKGKKASSPIGKKIEQKMKEQGATGPSKQAQKFYEGAVIEIDKGNFQAARINLKLAVQYDPANKKYKQALEELDKTEEGRKAESEFRAGVDSQLDGDLKKAASHFKTALELGFESPKLYHRYAELLIEIQGNHEKARSLLLKAIEMEPGVADYHMALARAYKGLKQIPAAVIQLEKVLKLDPKNKLAAKELKSLWRG